MILFSKPQTKLVPFYIKLRESIYRKHYENIENIKYENIIYMVCVRFKRPPMRIENPFFSDEFMKKLVNDSFWFP